jgi:hypothetical protein
MKKPYVKPAVVHSETIEARAISCARQTSSDFVCREGPIQS